MPRDNRLSWLIMGCIAVAAATCVLTVLITPAADELPRTAPHHNLHHLIFVSIAITPPLPAGTALPQAPGSALRAFRGADLLSLTCVRLC